MPDIISATCSASLSHDSLTHNSIVIGGTLSRAERRLFPHNDLDELDELLTSSRHRYERVLIAVEGLYSRQSSRRGRKSATDARF